MFLYYGALSSCCLFSHFPVYDYRMCRYNYFPFLVLYFGNLVSYCRAEAVNLPFT